MITISIPNAIAIVIASMSLGITISNAVQFFIISREKHTDADGNRLDERKK